VTTRTSIPLFALLGLIPWLGASAQTTIQNTSYGSGQSLTVSDPTSITANTNVSVASGAAIIYSSPGTITLGPGFTAFPGSYFQAIIASTAPTAQPSVVIVPGSATLNLGQSITLLATGGAGSGSYVWGGSAAGTGPETTLSFGAAGSYTVTLFRAADATYAQSNTTTIPITVVAAQTDSTNTQVQLKILVPTP
jgi:hypothetical protein